MDDRAWERLGYESPQDYIRDRFYDEREEPERAPFEGMCGGCDEYLQCTIEGHEGIGWCRLWKEFMNATDEECD